MRLHAITIRTHPCLHQAVCVAGRIATACMTKSGIGRVARAPSLPSWLDAKTCTMRPNFGRRFLEIDRDSPDRMSMLISELRILHNTYSYVAH